MAKVADFLVWLLEVRGFLSLVKTHRSMLSSVFRFKLPELGEHRVLHDLLRSFAIERPRRPQVPPFWDLDIVLRHLMSSDFEPLENASLRTLIKTLFLVSLVTAKRVGELQALSKRLAATGDDLMASFLPRFVAVLGFCRGVVRWGPRGGFSRVLCELSLCIYGELSRWWLEPTLCSYLLDHPVARSRESPFSFFLREAISEAGAVRDVAAPPPQIHSVRGVSTCFFSQELVDLQGAGGRNLEIELSFCLLRYFLCF